MLKRLTLFIASLILAQTAYSQQLQNSIQVTGLRASNSAQQYQLPPNIRISELLNRLVADPRSVDWQRSRLGSARLQNQLNEKKQRVLAELYQLKQWGIDEGNAELTNNASRLIELTSRSDFQASYFLGIPYYEQRAQRADNPVLQEPAVNQNENVSSDFTLTLYPADAAGRAALVGLFSEPSLITAGEKLNAAIETHSLQKGAEPNIAWLIRQNGDVAELPIAYFNRGQTAQCYPHSHTRPMRSIDKKQAVNCWPSTELGAGDSLFVGLKGHDKLNRQLVELLKFRVMPL